MDSCTSHLGYNTHQHPHCLGDEHVSQQNYPSGLGRPSVHVTNGLPVSHRSIDLFTRLIALEKDLQISQTENTKKEAVIQYLLYSKVSNAETEKLKEQNNNLEKEIARLNDDSERVKDKLGKALDTIFALSTPNVAGVVSQSISASCSSRCKSPSVEALKTEDLIDLLRSSEECASAVQTKEDTTLLDDIYDEVLDNKTTLEHSLHESLESPNLEFQAPPYIVHFADSDEEGKPNDSAKDVTSKIHVPWGTSEPVTLLPQPGTNAVTFTEFGDSSPEGPSSPRRSVSISTHFNSSTNGTTPPSIAGTDFLEKEFSQLATLALKRDEDESLYRSVALVRKMTQAMPSLDMHGQAEPSTPASIKQEELSGKVNASVIEPNWSLLRTFDSCQERESAASLNRRNGGSDELRYPDLFKYGVHFSPPDSERDVYRTIIVSNLPPDISLCTLLKHVRGGPIIDAKLLDTVRITGMKSALIIFLHEHAAMAFEDYAKKDSVKINGVAAQVHVVSTPTWPMRIPLRKAIFDHHHTRCLEVDNFPEQISAPRLRNDLMVCMEMNFDRITYMQKRKDGILELQFSSIDWAGHAYGMLSCFRAYRNCTPNFAPDPCARVLETFEGQQLACTVKAEIATKHTATPDAELAAVYQSGRLAKVEWESDPDLCRGRGFATGS